MAACTASRTCVGVARRLHHVQLEQGRRVADVGLRPLLKVLLVGVPLLQLLDVVGLGDEVRVLGEHLADLGHGRLAQRAGHRARARGSTPPVGRGPGRPRARPAVPGSSRRTALSGCCAVNTRTIGSAPKVLEKFAYVWPAVDEPPTSSDCPESTAKRSMPAAPSALITSAVTANRSGRRDIGPARRGPMDRQPLTGLFCTKACGMTPRHEPSREPKPLNPRPANCTSPGPDAGTIADVLIGCVPGGKLNRRASR